MKKYVIMVVLVLFILSPNKVGAIREGYEIVSTLPKEKITLYAKEINGLFHDFIINFKGEIYSRPFWINVTNTSYAPQIYYEEINQDKKKELIIILNKGYGTGVLQEEVFVYRYSNGLIEEVVDHPLAIIYRNIKTKVSTKSAEIVIGDNVYLVDVLEQSNLFEDIAFGGIINYEVSDNQLIVRVSARISPASIVGEVVIVYDYRDKMYQAKSIEFEPVEL
ncbi:hypothetical protein DS745_04155 [Anaerobacillus alkaliphilus]|uniref:Uncharacterized protein n=1 Tax=Anaerobacillus alkaliphilus TaxID=1548597 RepID=A0A4Q0VXV3_9BACI|nr:hypothetical protein [Anaerobacillus alkaliphilus]RXJ04583.1 hypothetical protein DS745_04155 [Anaerobacillus alkaliphilus]